MTLKLSAFVPSDRPGSSGVGSGRDSNSDSGSEDLRLGGMALQNGLLVHSPGYWAAAIREPQGEIVCASGKKRRLPGAGPVEGIPFVRGLIRMTEAMLVLPRVKSRLGQAVLPTEVPRVLAATVFSSVATVALRRSRGGVLSQEIGAAALALGPALLALKDSPLARYHGAEHMSIGEVEESLRREHGQSEGLPESHSTEGGGPSREHGRCGSHAVAPLLASTIAGNAVLRSISRRPSQLSLLVVNVLSLGFALEVFRWMTRNPGSSVARALAVPGHLLQRFLTTDEPTPDQLEVGRTAVREVLRLEGLQPGA